jgi:putative toxin-antitoxin system antitoxin component (TIGR02293 family)
MGLRIVQNGTRGKTEGRDMTTASGESLGLKDKGLMDLIERLKKGLPYSMLVKFHKTSGLPLAEIEAAIGLPRSTRARRKNEGVLKQHESERLLRLSRLYDEALILFHGNAESTRQWFLRPSRPLNGKTPLAFSSTEVGAQEVANVIGRLQHGVGL